MLDVYLLFSISLLFFSKLNSKTLQYKGHPETIPSLRSHIGLLKVTHGWGLYHVYCFRINMIKPTSQFKPFWP